MTLIQSMFWLLFSWITSFVIFSMEVARVMLMTFEMNHEEVMLIKSIRGTLKHKQFDWLSVLSGKFMLSVQELPFSARLVSKTITELEGREFEEYMTVSMETFLSWERKNTVCEVRYRCSTVHTHMCLVLTRIEFWFGEWNHSFVHSCSPTRFVDVVSLFRFHSNKTGLSTSVYVLSSEFSRLFMCEL
jgi:hypothetical protein